MFCLGFGFRKKTFYRQTVSLRGIFIPSHREYYVKITRIGDKKMLQDGPLLAINGVVTLINGLKLKGLEFFFHPEINGVIWAPTKITGMCNPYKWPETKWVSLELFHQMAPTK